MDTLRTVLIILGLIAIAAIWGWESYKRHRHFGRYNKWGGLDEEDQGEAQPPVRRSRPWKRAGAEDDTPDPPVRETGGREAELKEELRTLGDWIAEDTSAPESSAVTPSPAEPQPAAEPPPESEPEPQAPPLAPQRVIALNLIAPEPSAFEGADVFREARNAGLQYGAMQIFHCHAPNGSAGGPLFSMANMFEPGHFDSDNLEEFTTRGLILFMTLPNPGDALQSFERMLAAGRKLADALDGELRDDQRSVLTRQGIERMREDIREFDLRATRH